MAAPHLLFTDHRKDHGDIARITAEFIRDDRNRPDYIDRLLPYRSLRRKIVHRHRFGRLSLPRIDHVPVRRMVWTRFGHGRFPIRPRFRFATPSRDFDRSPLFGRYELDDGRRRQLGHSCTDMFVDEDATNHRQTSQERDHSPGNTGFIRWPRRSPYGYINEFRRTHCGSWISIETIGSC